MTLFLQRLRAAGNLILKGSIPADWFARPGLGYDTGTDSLSSPYLQSGWVMRAIKTIANPIASVPLKFEDPADEEIEIDDPRLELYWEAPAAALAGRMTLPDVVEATVGWLKLRGEAFWLLPDNAIVPFPEVRAAFPPFIIARPDRMRPVVENGRFIAWEFTDGNARRFRLIAEQVIHFTFWNPYDELRGAAEYGATQPTAEADYMAAVYQRNLWQNNGDRGPIIGVKGGMPTDEQREQITAQLREKQNLARKGIFKAAFISGDITVEDPKAALPDAGFIESRKANKHEIYAVLGVPPSMAEVTASYSIGSASDRFRLIEDTCQPLAAKIAAQISKVSSFLIGRPVKACFDWDEHSTMQQVRAERIAAAKDLWDRGMSWGTINEYLHLGLPDFDGMDVAYLPFSVAPAQAPGMEMPAVEPSTSADFAEPQDTQDSVELAMRALRSPVATEEQRAGEALWRRHMSLRREVIKLYTVKFNRELMKARAEVLARLNNGGAKSAEKQRAGAALDFMFDLTKWRAGFFAAMREATGQALDIAGQQLFEEIKRDDPFKFPPSKAISFLQQRENKLSGAPQEIFDQVRDALQAGLDDGDSIAQLSNKVRDAFNGISKERATRIAMTETAAAYGTARQEAMQQSGVAMKKWLTSGNANVRATHAQAGRDYSTPIPVGDPFYVGGEKLMYPGDPTGSPENVINCHCVSIAVEGDPNQ